MFQWLLKFTLKHLSIQFIFYICNVTELQYATEYGVLKLQRGLQNIVYFKKITTK